MTITQQELLNARIMAFGDDPEMQALKKAQAYYDNRPGEFASYARAGVPRSDWPKVRVLLARRIVDTSAAFLFGRTPKIDCPTNPALGRWVNRVWRANDMQSQLVAMARRGGIDGKVALKFAYDPGDAANPFPISILPKSCFRETYDDLDRKRLLKLTVRFQYISAQDGETYHYREDWTPEEWTVYHPIPAERAMGVRYTQGMGWVVRERVRNPFGFIPAVVIRNLVDAEDPAIGISDIEGLYDLFDRINIAYDQWDESNAISARRIYFGKKLTAERLDVRPGDVITGNMEDSDLKAVTGGESVYHTLRDYAERLEQHAIAAARSTFIDSSRMQAMNNLSSVALRMLHTDLLMLTEEKRLNYGTNGVEKLLELLVRAAKLSGYRDEALEGVDLSDPESWQIQLHYPAPFPMTEDERRQALQNLDLARSLGALSEERVQVLAAALYEG